MNTFKSFLASWATNWHHYVPVDHQSPPPTNQLVTQNFLTTVFRVMEIDYRGLGHTLEILEGVCKVAERCLDDVCERFLEDIRP